VGPLLGRVGLGRAPGLDVTFGIGADSRGFTGTWGSDARAWCVHARRPVVDTAFHGTCVGMGTHKCGKERRILDQVP
jgi:hypothetical protein